MQGFYWLLFTSLVYDVAVADYCGATWDTILCWPPVPAGQTVYMSCPPYPGLDPHSKSLVCDVTSLSWTSSGNVNPLNRNDKILS